MNPLGQGSGLFQKRGVLFECFETMELVLVNAADISSFFSLCSLIHSPVTLSLLGPIILSSTLFEEALTLFFSLNVYTNVN